MDELGHLLVAAYKLDDPDHFADFSAEMIKELVPGNWSWDCFPELELLPDCLKGIPLPQESFEVGLANSFRRNN